MITLTFLGTQLPASFNLPVPEGMVGVAIYNSSPIQYAVSSAPISVSTASSAVNVSPGFAQGVPFDDARNLYLLNANGAVPATGNILNLYIYVTGEEATFPGPFVAPFGVSIYGSVGPGNTLNNVLGGAQVNFGDIQQLINALTGVMTGQAYHLAGATQIDGGLTVNNGGIINGGLMVHGGEILPDGDVEIDASHRLRLVDANSKSKWLRALTDGVAAHLQVVNDAFTTIILDLDDVGNLGSLATATASGQVAGGTLKAGTQVPPTNGLGVQGRISAPAVGASGKTLLNFVPIPAASQKTWTPMTDGAWHSLDISANVPASAVMVIGALAYSTANASGVQSLALGANGGPPGGEVFVQNAVQTGNWWSFAIVPVSGQAIFYQATSAISPSGLYVIYGYWEAA